MSTVPPPQFQSKEEWKAWREQQKIAWRAQREQFKQQRDAWKAQYGVYYAPRVPSIVGPLVLIGIGVVGFLVVTNRIASGSFWQWYVRWWPLVLIFVGAAMLAEWALDARRPVPVRRNTGAFGILVLCAIFGIGASGWDHFWGPMRAQFGDGHGDFFNALGQPEHDQDVQSYHGSIASGATLVLDNPRGDVSISASDDDTLDVQSHLVAFASSDNDAKPVYDAETPHVSVNGNAIQIKSNGHDHGRVNLTITVPRSTRVTINAGHGDVTVAGLGGGLTLAANQGDIHLNSIDGDVHVRTQHAHNDFTAHQINGNLDISGDCNDFILSEVSGRVTHNGEILGDVHIEQIAGSLHLHTSITDVELVSLPGDMSLNPENLRITEASGNVRVMSHSKDIDLVRINGDIYVEDRDGRIALETIGNHSVQAKNGKGDVEVTLAPNSAVTIDAHTRNGEIISDYTMPSIPEGAATKNITFHIGGGGSAQMSLSAENGDVRIKRGEGEEPPSSPHPPKVMRMVAPPAAPVAPAAPHLRTQHPTKSVEQ